MTRTTLERMVTGLLGMALLAGAPHSPVGAQASPPRLGGSWTARWKPDTERPWIQLRESDTHRSTMSLPQRDVDQLVASADPDGNVHLDLSRDAGRLALDGTLWNGRGEGSYTFQANAAYAQAMADAGVPVPDADAYLAAALHDVRPGSVAQLRAEGFSGLDFDDVLTASIFQVDSTWVDELRALGLDGDLDQFIAFRIHGVTPEFVRDARSWGLGELGADELISFRIHGVTRDFVQEARALGGQSLDADDVVSFRIHGVTGEFARAVAGWGFGTPDADELIALKIHRVTPEFIDSMREAGVPPEDLEQAVAFRIHGVTPELVDELHEAGFEGLTGDDLIKVRIHGLDRLLKKRSGGG